MVTEGGNLDRSEDYLQVPFRDDQRELEQVQEIIKETSATFGTVVVDRKWPYELTNGQLIPRRTYGRYSSSTNAMILFSLIVAAGRTAPDCPLVPWLHKRGAIDFGTGWKAFQTAHERLSEETETQIKTTENHHISWSTSFGWDDPFTLSWLIEIDR